MKIAQAQTAIDCFHGRVQSDKHGQYEKILSVMQPNRDYSMQELGALTGLQTATISARLNELRKFGKLVHAEKRQCTVSGVKIEPHKLPAEQLELV